MVYRFILIRTTTRLSNLFLLSDVDLVFCSIVIKTPMWIWSDSGLFSRSGFGWACMLNRLEVTKICIIIYDRGKENEHRVSINKTEINKLTLHQKRYSKAIFFWSLHTHIIYNKDLIVSACMHPFSSSRYSDIHVHLLASSLCVRASYDGEGFGKPCNSPPHKGIRAFLCVFLSLMCSVIS